MPEPVDDEFDPQQQRDGGEHEGRGPQVAAEPAVEQARGDEAPGQPRVVEPLDARPARAGPRWGWRRWADWRRAASSRPAPTPSACPLPSHSAGRPPSTTVHAATRSSARTSSRSVRAGAITTITCESGAGGEGAERGGELGVGCRAPRRAEPSGHPGATRRPQMMTMPGALPFLEAAGDVAARGRGAVGWLGGSRRSPMTSTRRPRATSMRVPRAVRLWLGAGPAPRCRRRCPCGVHRVTSGASTPPPRGEVASAGGRSQRR